MRLVTHLTPATCFTTVGATVPLGRAMSALCWNSCSALLNESAFDAEITVQVLLLRVLEVGGDSIESNPSVPCRGHALLVNAARDQVLAVETAPICHVVALIAEAGARVLICVLIPSLLSALANAFLHKEIVTDALSAQVLRLTRGAARDGCSARDANPFIQIVALFALHAAVLVALTALAMLDEPALLALAVADEVIFTALLAAASGACLALPSKSLLATNALSVKTEVTFLTLLTLQPIVTLFAVDVYIFGALLACAILDEGALDATLVCKGEESKQDTHGSHNNCDHEDSEQVITPH